MFRYLLMEDAKQTRPDVSPRPQAEIKETFSVAR